MVLKEIRRVISELESRISETTNMLNWSVYVTTRPISHNYFIGILGKYILKNPGHLVTPCNRILLENLIVAHLRNTTSMDTEGSLP
jgi:hypothetical protein